MNPRVTFEQLLRKKGAGEKITVLTAYDYPLARLIDGGGVDIVLVGDSVANVVLGLDSTREVGMSDMLYHARAARRGVERALLVGDMPFGSYESSPDTAAVNARRFADEAGCDGVKLEWFDGAPAAAAAIRAAGVPVMGHVGLTPQTADRLGGFKVRGRGADEAAAIVEQAAALEAAGCFALVLECMPDRVAALITARSRIPTIGIGAGPSCDGQVLVTHDLLGLFDRYRPKFVKQFAAAGETIREGIRGFCNEVGRGDFPGPAQSYTINDRDFAELEQRFAKGPPP